ncbi:MAG TPA: hypothetical protein DCO77_00825 [Nitrospiraceae bacterium]|nr:hypothetical protein [Nitrospiraceae bacterium]
MTTKTLLRFLVLLLVVLTGCTVPAIIRNAGPPAECVIVLHGMGRTASSMRAMEKHLTQAGYRVVNVDYPSTSKTIPQISTEAVAGAVSQCRRGKLQPIHFVTHSLGGILVRQYLQHSALPWQGKIVMIAPPNKGSEVADRLKDFFIYRWATGPVGQALGTGPDSLPNQLKPITAEIGIIAGSKSLNPLFSRYIPGPDDGKVAIARTKLAGMKDFIIVPSSHTFIMSHPTVLRQTVYFLGKGFFDHEPEQDEENQLSPRNREAL